MSWRRLVAKEYTPNVLCQDSNTSFAIPMPVCLKCIKKEEKFSGWSEGSELMGAIREMSESQNLYRR
jgi:hypothetical protein